MVGMTAIDYIRELHQRLEAQRRELEDLRKQIKELRSELEKETNR